MWCFFFSEARCIFRCRGGLKVTPKGGECAISFTLCELIYKSVQTFNKCIYIHKRENSVKLIAPLSPLRFHLKNPFLTPLYA